MSIGNGKDLDFNTRISFFEFRYQLHKNGVSTVKSRFSECPYFYFATLVHLEVARTQKLSFNTQISFFRVPVFLFCHFGASRSCPYFYFATLEHLDYRRIKRNRVFACSPQIEIRRITKKRILCTSNFTVQKNATLEHLEIRRTNKSQL